MEIRQHPPKGRRALPNLTRVKSGKKPGDYRVGKRLGLSCRISNDPPVSPVTPVKTAPP